MRRRWKCGSSKVSPDVFTKSFFGSLCTQCWFASLVGPRTSTTGPSSRRTCTCTTPFPVYSSCCNRTSPCLMSLRSQNLCWFSQPLRFSQRWEMSAGNDACSPRDYISVLWCASFVRAPSCLVMVDCSCTSVSTQCCS